MNVFGYCRVSTTMQAEEGYSLEEQKSRIEAYCKGMGWNLLKVYVDAGESGAKADRPALQEMIRNIKMVDKVVVYKLDRLSRSQKDTLYLIEDVFLKNNVEFVSMTESLDTATPFGKAMLGTLAVFAQLERETIKERMALGRVARAKSGKYSGNPRTVVGYDYIDGELLINESERPQIERLFDLILQGKSFSETARILNSEGYAHKYGEWKRGLVRNVVVNPIYTGKVSFEGVLYDGNHQAIIPESKFEQANSLTENRKSRLNLPTKTGRANSYLGGLLVCAHCGQRYYRHQGVRGQPQYICYTRMNNSQHEDKCFNKRWSMSELDDLILGQVKLLSLDPPKPKKKKTVNKQAEMDKLDEQMNRLLDLFALGTVPMETLQKKMDAINQKKLDLQKKEKAQLDWHPMLRSFEDVIANGTLEEVRAILFNIIDYIEVDNQDVSIHWKFF